MGLLLPPLLYLGSSGQFPEWLTFDVSDPKVLRGVLEGGLPSALMFEDLAKIMEASLASGLSRSLFWAHCVDPSDPFWVAPQVAAVPTRSGKTYSQLRTFLDDNLWVVQAMFISGQPYAGQAYLWLRELAWLLWTLDLPEVKASLLRVLKAPIYHLDRPLHQPVGYRDLYGALPAMTQDQLDRGPSGADSTEIRLNSSSS